METITLTDVNFDRCCFLIKKKFFSLLIIFAKVAACLGIIFGLSVVTYVLWYRKVVPKALIEEKVYFDFGLTEPRASISLVQKERTWENLQNVIPPCQHSSSALISGNYYDFILSVKVPKSIRNMKLLKTSVNFRVIDCNGQTIANSVRPLTVPFQSVISLYLESLLLFPVRFLGYFPSEEFTIRKINLLDNFKEASGRNNQIRSHRIELQLASADLDIAETNLYISPRLSTIRYCLFHYPGVSFIVGVTILSIFQIGFYGAIISVAVAFSFLFAGETVVLSNQSPSFGKTELYDEVLDSTTFRFQLPLDSQIKGAEEVENEIEDVTSIYWRKKNE